MQIDPSPSQSRNCIGVKESMKKLTSLFLALLLVLTCMQVMASAEGGTKVYRSYMGTDCPILNAQNSVQTSLDTPTSYCGAFLYRAVPDEDGGNFHYIGDMLFLMKDLLHGHINQLQFNLLIKYLVLILVLFI